MNLKRQYEVTSTRRVRDHPEPSTTTTRGPSAGSSAGGSSPATQSQRLHLPAVAWPRPPSRTLFVAMPSEAAANGDYLLPTVLLSCSPTSRGISNGFTLLLMALGDERNHQLLERDLRYAWWNNHCVVDAAIGTFIEYGTRTAARIAKAMRRCGDGGSMMTTIVAT